VHEIVDDFEAKECAAGGPAVARARSDLRHLLEAELEGARRMLYAVISGSPRLLLRAANAASGVLPE
jgi:hypothetical protein